MLIDKIKNQSQEYGVPWWKLPDMMMIYLAIINIITMIGTYWWFSSRWYDPRAAVLVVAAEAISSSMIKIVFFIFFAYKLFPL